MSEDNGETTPLHSACLHGNMEMVKLLIQDGANVNLKMNAGSTCLLIACQANNIEMVRLLLENRANPDLKTEGGVSCLDIAALNKNIEMVHTGSYDVKVEEEGIVLRIVQDFSKK